MQHEPVSLDITIESSPATREEVDACIEGLMSIPGADRPQNIVLSDSVATKVIEMALSEHTEE